MSEELPATQTYPDFTEEQRAILQQIANTPAYRTRIGFSWSLAFKEHPEWEKILLTDQGRPISHLWHASRELQNGKMPARPFTHAYKSKRKKGRGQRKVKLVKVRDKYTWPGVEAMNRKRAELRAARDSDVREMVRTLPTTSVAAATFCPHCGAHKSHFGNQA